MVQNIAVVFVFLFRCLSLDLYLTITNFCVFLLSVFLLTEEQIEDVRHVFSVKQNSMVYFRRVIKDTGAPQSYPLRDFSHFDARNT